MSDTVEAFSVSYIEGCVALVNGANGLEQCYEEDGIRETHISSVVAISMTGDQVLYLINSFIDDLRVLKVENDRLQKRVVQLETIEKGLE